MSKRLSAGDKHLVSGMAASADRVRADGVSPPRRNQKDPCLRPVKQNVGSSVWSSGFKIELEGFNVKIRQG